MRIDRTMFEHDGELLKLKCGVYSNKRLAIRIMSDEVPYAVLTVNLPEYDLKERHILVKTWSENEVVSKNVLVSTKLFTDTNIRVPTGFCNAEVWKINEDVYIT